MNMHTMNCQITKLAQQLIASPPPWPPFPLYSVRLFQHSNLIRILPPTRHKIDLGKPHPPRLEPQLIRNTRYNNNRGRQIHLKEILHESIRAHTSISLRTEANPELSHKDKRIEDEA